MENNESSNELEDSVDVDFATGSSTFIRIKDHDTCHLIQDTNEADCCLCKLEGRFVKTFFRCDHCKVAACGSCYGKHKIETLFVNLWSSVGEHHIPLKLSDCGEFVEANVTCDYKNDVENIASISSMTVDSDLRCSDILNEDAIQNNFAAADLAATLTLLKEDYATIPITLFDSTGKLSVLIFQDNYMKDFFHFYHHQICLTLMGKFADMALYMLLSEDSQGCHQIIAVILDSTEDQSNLKFALSTFKCHNPLWFEVAVFVVDPLIFNIDVIYSQFPSATILVCSYHLYKTFANNVKNNRITNVYSQAKNIDDFLKSFILACSPSELKQISSLMTEEYGILPGTDVLQSIIAYSWSFRLDNHSNFLSSLNKFLKLLSIHIDSVLIADNDLCNFIDRFFLIVKLLRNEYGSKSRAVVEFTQPIYSPFSPHFTISLVLMPYASEFIHDQLRVSEKISVNTDSRGPFKFEKTVSATSDECTCAVYILARLPCSHIFAVRKALSLPVFVDALCSKHWTKQYFRFSQSLLSKVSSRDTLPPVSDCIDKLVPLLLRSDSSLFERRTSLLKEMIAAWTDSKSVILYPEGTKITRDEPINISPTEVIVQDFANKTPSDSDSVTSTASMSVAATSESEITTSAPLSSYNIWPLGSHLFGEKLINLLYLSIVICRSKAFCVEWLQCKQFLPNDMRCPACGSGMAKVLVSRLADGAIWTCMNEKQVKRSCTKRCTVRKNTWFEATNMTLEIILKFCYMWIHCYSQNHIISELGISTATCAAWDKTFQKICLASLNMRDDVMDGVVDSMQIRTMWYLEQSSGEDVFLLFLQAASLWYKPDGGV